MIVNDIVADDLGPGTDNPARIAALRTRLSTLHSDGVPFLLLPVRLETRFLRVDRPVAGAEASPLTQVSAARAQLDAIAARNFATTLTPATRVATKATEQAHARFLDAAGAALDAARLPVLTSLRSSSALFSDDPVALRAASTALTASYTAAQASVARLRSAFQREAYRVALSGLHDRVIAPIQAEIDGAAAPKLELLAALRAVPVKDVRKRIAELQARIDGLGARPSPTDVAHVRDAVATALQALRDLAHGVLRGTQAELDALHAEWRAAAVAVHGVSRLAGAALRPPRVATPTLDALLPDLAALAGGPVRSFETLTNLRLDRSARAVAVVDAQMTALGRALDMPPAPASGRGAQVLMTASQAIAAATAAEAALRDVAILPVARYTAAVTRYQACARALAAWRSALVDLATRGDASAPVLVRELDAAFAALARATLSQRTDAWGAYAAPLDVVRRKLFAVDPTATRTVDELWVRIFPDDIAVHTHEPALTDDERRDGTAYWVEVTTAHGDDALLRGAWRALAQRYGSPRAAWIARALAPPPAFALASEPFAAGARLVRAVDTLQRRIADHAPRADRAASPGLRKMLAAADLALAAARTTDAVSPAQARRTRAAGSLIRGQLDGLTARLRRRVPPGQPRHAELATLADRITELERATAAIATRDPHQAPHHEALRRALAAPPSKAAAWTQAPHCPVLPERFVVLAVRGDRVVHAVAGETVGDLRVGLDPNPDAPDEGFTLDDDGNLAVGASIRWMVDFDEAIANGMAIRVPITSAEAAAGFDELLVVGVREAAAGDAGALIQGLIDNHHYTAGGMAFLPIGASTNNTEAQVAAHRSDDDPDHSYDLERGAPLFDPSVTSPLDAADGLRFARALGLDPAVVAHLDHAGGRDAGDARIMNEALWPATLGSYLEEFLGSLVSPDTAHRLRGFFRDHVSARGWIPAFRVGHQPYGVLTTTAFSKLVPDGGDALPAGDPAVMSEADRQRRFDVLLRDLLAAITADWSRIRASKVPHVHRPGITDAQRTFMDILGLSPASVAAEYRFALNVGSRHPASVSSAAQLPFGFSPLGPFGLFDHFDGFLRRAYRLPPDPLVDDKGLVSDPLRPFYQLLGDERAYSVRVLDRARALRGEVAGAAGSYTGGLLARPIAGLVDDARHRRGASHALLFLLLRHALLGQALSSALNILALEGMVTPDARRRAGASDEFLVRTLTADVFSTKWSYVFGALAQLDGRFDVHFPTGAGTLFSYLTAGTPHTMADYLANRGDNPLFNGFAGHARHAAERTELTDHADRVARVGQIAAPRLDALVREHLDLCSHRVDAWQLGQAVRRLTTMRAQTPSGVFLGAYGWLENLRPKVQPPVATGVPPSLHRDGEPQVVADPENEGFLHTPSLSHAVTAAILRSAYLSETDAPDVENAMAINLSSRRVRLALELLDGVQAGNDLGALLGYRFERELHDAYATEGVSFDALIFALRRQYPGAGAVDPAISVPDTARRLVVDGLALLNAVRHWVEANVALAARRDASLFEVLMASATATLPVPAGALDGPHRAGVFRALDSLADAVDAIGDLALSEAVYQIVRGNFPRAAAVVAALAEGKPLPRPQIARTPRSGTSVAHRVLLPLRRFDGRTLSSLTQPDPVALAAARAAALPPGWTQAMTARANVEPGLNHWLGELLGDPAHIVCRFDDPASGPDVRELTAQQLGLQPLDLLAMLGGGLEDGAAELAVRIAYHELPAAITAPRPAIALRIDERGATWSAADRSFAEIEPLLVELRAMLGRARAALPEDVVFDESVAGAPPAGPSWNADELAARLAEGQVRIRALAGAIMTALGGAGDDLDTLDPTAWARAHAAVFDDPGVLARTRELGSLALGAADFGVTVALPPIRFDSAEAAIAGLRAAVLNGFVQLVERLRASVAAGDLIEGSRALFGHAFVVAPAFALPDGATVRAQLAAPDLLRAGDAFAIDGWLAGVATVREPIAALRRAYTLGEAFGAPALEPRPAQLPAQDGDAWLGLAFPTDHVPSSDKLSLVVLRGDAWAASGEVSALLVDQWTEVIPNRSETTGVAFHYDTPDAMPPQSLLLVVPPVMRGTWRWDDLVHALHDTLDLARSRAVEPEHLTGEVYAQLLPALTGELVPDHLADDGEVGGSRVILDFGLNNAS